MMPPHRRAHCHDCGYCLYGLSERCPECGRRFDPANTLSVSLPPAGRDWVGIAATVIIIVFALVLET